jgi:DNA processing protein
VSPRNPADWIAVNMLPGLGPVTLHAALERFGDPALIAHDLPVSALEGLPRRAARIDAARIARARRGLRRRAEKELRLCRRRGVRLLPWPDPDYPAALRELPDPPLLLYLKGRLPQRALRVAVVGSRTPTAYGQRVAAGLGQGLAARGAEVVSGGALGVDTLAHRGAVEEQGRTVAVLGSGLDEPYPRRNAAFFERIAGQGALLSEFPMTKRAERSTFPRRNRLIAGLSAAVVVVEAAERSGSLITADLALDQGREVLAVPGPVSSLKSVGCNRLIQQGAKLVQNIDDILEELPPFYLTALPRGGAPAGPDEPPDRSGLAPDELRVLKMMDPSEPVHLDRLAETAPFGVARLQTALFGLELRGAVEQTPGRYYLLRPRKEP